MMGTPDRGRRALLEVASAPRSAKGMATGDVAVSGVADQNLGVLGSQSTRFVAEEQVSGAQLAVSQHAVRRMADRQPLGRIALRST